MIAVEDETEEVGFVTSIDSMGPGCDLEGPSCELEEGDIEEPMDDEGSRKNAASQDKTVEATS